MVQRRQKLEERLKQNETKSKMHPATVVENIIKDTNTAFNKVHARLDQIENHKRNEQIVQGLINVAIANEENSKP